MSTQLTEITEEVFRCVWGDHEVPLAEAADSPASICLSCEDEVAELEEREYASPWREVV